MSVKSSYAASVALAAALLLVSAPWAAAGDQSAPGTAAGDEQAVAVPQTPDEHIARAKTYEEKAAAYRQEVATHRKMLADYDKAQGNPALESKTGKELPWVAKMRKHCESYIKEAERMAGEATRFAEFHRMRAAEMQGK